MISIGIGVAQGGGSPMAPYIVGGVSPLAVIDFERGFATLPWSLTRASAGSAMAADGTIYTAPIDTPRFTYMTGARTLLLENTATRVLGGAAPSSAQSATVTEQVYALSFYGAGTVTLSGAASATVSGTGATVRRTYTFTPTAGTLTASPSGDVRMLQLEAAAVTSYIPGADGSVTRAADVVAPIDVSGLGLSGGYTAVAWGKLDAVVGSYDRIMTLDIGADETRLHIQYDNILHQIRAAQFTASVVQASSGATATANLPFAFRSAATVGPNYFQYAQNGVAGAIDNTVTYVAPTVLRLAQALSGAKPSRLLLSRVAIYPGQLTGAQLIEVTT